MKEQLKEILKHHKLKLTFKKVDGSVRIMVCSLQPSELPPITESTLVKTEKKKDNPNILSVFDLEKQEWRSLVVENLISIEILK